MNSFRFFFSISMLLATATAHAQTIVDISFDNEGYAKYLEATVDGVRLGESSSQESCLIIDGEVDACLLKPITVQPLQKYKLTMRASIDAKDTIETNDRLLEFSSTVRGKGFAGCDLYFSNNEGKNISFTLQGNDRFEGARQASVERVPVITGEFHDYVVVFYAPPTATALHINLTPQKQTLLVERLIVELDDVEKSVNCNPDFLYGELNLSGWKPDAEGRLFLRPDGKTVLKCGTSTLSSMFVVNDELRYSFDCKGVGYDKRSGKVIVLFFDASGKELGHTHLFWDKDMQNGAIKAGLRPIPKAKFAMIKASLVILEKVKVTKDLASSYGKTN